MPSSFEHQFHQNIIYTSNRRYSIHINKNSSIGLENFLQSGIIRIDDVLHAQQGRTVARKSSIRGLYVCAGRLDV